MVPLGAMHAEPCTRRGRGASRPRSTYICASRVGARVAMVAIATRARAIAIDVHARARARARMRRARCHARGARYRSSRRDVDFEVHAHWHARSRAISIDSSRSTQADGSLIIDHRLSTLASGSSRPPRRRGWGTAHPGPPGEPPDPAAAAPMHAAAASAAHGGGVGAALVEVLQSAAAPAAATRLSQGITTTEGGCGTTSSASAAAGRTETPGGGVTRHAHAMTWSASSCPVKIPLQARAQHAERARRRGMEGGCQRATTRVGRGREGVGRACAVPHGMWSPCLPTTWAACATNKGRRRCAHAAPRLPPARTTSHAPGAVD